MGATHFLMKTLPRVASEMALHVLAYNLTRVMNIMGIRPLMAAMRASPLSALCTANEVAAATEAGPGTESFFECKRMDRMKPSAAAKCLGSWMGIRPLMAAMRASPLSALCTANEVAIVIEAGPKVESSLNAKGWLRTRSSAAMGWLESSRSTETF